ncbi:MAG: hypothetical protein V3U29_08400 [Phycisphaeraceae bacterium]
MSLADRVRLASVRPLVRYVDEDQAVIETHLSTRPQVPTEPTDDVPRDVEVLIEINGSDGFHDEGSTPVQLEDGHGAVLFEMVQPQRWWPAGMGDQQLYELSISLVVRNVLADTHKTTLGLTSVRVPKPDTPHTPDASPYLLVNGRVCDIHSVVSIDAADEQKMLPVAGDSLIIVRGHYGPDVLYDAADRAGILLIQCVPIHPDGTPEAEVQAHVDRLARHPSLAGWCVGHLGQVAQSIAHTIKSLDPTHSVFMDPPGQNAA